MSKPKHTDGPWGFLKYQIMNDYMIFGPEGSLQKIAELSDSSDCERLGRSSNAALIAAAPELYQELKMILLQICGDKIEEGHRCHKCASAQNALAKARGA